MRVMGTDKIYEFIQASNDRKVEAALCAWLAEAKAAIWERPSQVFLQYQNAKQLASGEFLFVFEIDDYSIQIKTMIHFQMSISLIKEILVSEAQDR